MSEMKIKVPEGMILAARRAHMERTSFPSGTPYDTFCLTELPSIIEAALRWQKEHPPVPTDSQLGELVKECRAPDVPFWEKTTEWHRSIILCGAWVNRMYDEPEPESVTNCRPLPKNYDDGRGRYKCSDCGNIFDPGSWFQSNCQNCVSIAHRVYLAKAYTAKHNGEPIPQPPSWIFLNLKEKMHGGSSIFDQGEDSLCAIRLKDDALNPEVPEAIKDLIPSVDDMAGMAGGSPSIEGRLTRREIAQITSIAIEAYRRGQKAGTK